jgi:hypothetical protein
LSEKDDKIPKSSCFYSKFILKGFITIKKVTEQ